MTAIELLPEYVQAAALVLAGAWAYWRFFHQRSDEPATDIDVDAQFLGSQGDHQIVQVTAILENKSLVRHRYENFRMNLRYLLPGDISTDGEEQFYHQLVFPHSIDERLPDKQHRYFPRAEYINPRQRFHHRYVTFIPGDATFIRVHCKFEFRPAGIRALRPSASRQHGGTITDHSQQSGDATTDDSQRGGVTTTVDSQRVFRVPETGTSAPVRSAG